MSKDLRNAIKAQLCKDSAAFERIECIESISKGIEDCDPLFVENILVGVLIHDDNPVVRHEAAFVLGRLYAAGTISGHTAIPALCKSARTDCSPLVRHEATESLGCSAHPESLRVLVELLCDANPDIAATAQIGIDRIANRGEGEVSSK